MSINDTKSIQYFCNFTFCAVFRTPKPCWTPTKMGALRVMTCSTILTPGFGVTVTNWHCIKSAKAFTEKNINFKYEG